MKVELIESMGSDLTVVNAARVSFNKFHDYFDASDERLIHYLAKHNHWSPFAHPQVSLRISAPMFVARQLVKHQVGLTWNEVSRRYVDKAPELYIPVQLRNKSNDKKQGSEGIHKESGWWRQEISNSLDALVGLYEDLIEDGVCPEQARIVLPLATMTEWIWTGSLYAFHRVYKQRTHEGAQEETKEIAVKIGTIMEGLFPFSWNALNNNE